VEGYDETTQDTPADEGQGTAPNDPTQTGPEAELTEEQKAQAAADATQGDQGPEIREQDAAATGPAGFDPNRPVADSPPPPDAQSGVPTGPTLPENEGVEPGTPGPVEPGGSAGSPGSTASPEE
jgi:hypothetical protein